MAPSGGSHAAVPHTAQAGVVNESDPHTFYPFCSANDFVKGDVELPTAEQAKADPDLQAHVRSMTQP